MDSKANSNADSASWIETSAVLLTLWGGLRALSVADDTGQTIHRIDPAVVQASAKAAGLAFIDKSDVLANPTDDRSKGVFDATVRRHTDQFLFRFRKP